MTQHDRRGWLVIGGVVAVNFIVMGPSIGTITIFLIPLIKQFGWSREQVSMIATAFLIAMGVINPLIGWLLDRMAPRIPMAVGVVLAGGSFLVASRVNSLGALVACYAVMGLGVGGSTITPGLIVAANWFSARRALAIGITIAGAGLGGCVLPPLVSHLIAVYGWRETMVFIGLPMFVLALPILIALVRKPAVAEVEAQAAAATGLELGPALLTMAFWMLLLAQLGFTVAFTGSYFHMVPYLIGIGYTSESAALVFGAAVAVSLPGYLVLGTLADWYGAKPVLAGSLIIQAISMLLLLGLGGHHLALLVLAVFIIAYGLTIGSGTALGSALLAEALGLKSFGALAGIIGLVATVGSGIGPIIAGKIYDTTSSYTLAFELCSVLMLAAAIFASLVYPAERSDVAPPVAVRAQH
jgi:MFS family permease